MSRYRLQPSRGQQEILLRHCSDARYVWNLAVEQHAWWRPGRAAPPWCPAYTSQCCSACGHVASESRESQALFRCAACNYTENADVNAARNIAAGHAVTARGGLGNAQPTNREPQLLLLSA